MILEDFCIHPKAAKQIASFAANPTGNLLLYGNKGVGKAALATVLGLKITNRAEFLSVIIPEKGSINIDQIRSIKQSLKLKTLDYSSTRCVVIVDADCMTIEAQNALLKLLEEPPLNTHFILTSSSKRKLLSTVLSRVNELYIPIPSKVALQTLLKQKGHSIESVESAMKSSLGLPGLCTAILEGVNTEYVEELELAKAFLRSSMAEKLRLVDKVAKNRDQALSLVESLNVITLATLESIPKSVEKWVKAAKLLMSSEEDLNANANAKLVLTKLSLELG